MISERPGCTTSSIWTRSSPTSREIAHACASRMSTSARQVAARAAGTEGAPSSAADARASRSGAGTVLLYSTTNCRSSWPSEHDVDLFRVARTRGRAGRGGRDRVAELPTIEERVDGHGELLLPPGALATRIPAPERRGAERCR